MLETQTQIIGAGCDMPAEERIEWLQIYADSIVLGKERLQRELDRLNPSEEEITKAAEEILQLTATREGDFLYGDDLTWNAEAKRAEVVAILRKLIGGVP